MKNEEGRLGRFDIHRDIKKATVGGSEWPYLTSMFEWMSKRKAEKLSKDSKDHKWQEVEEKSSAAL